MSKNNRIHGLQPRDLDRINDLEVIDLEGGSSRGLSPRHSSPDVERGKPDSERSKSDVDGGKSKDRDIGRHESVGSNISNIGSGQHMLRELPGLSADVWERSGGNWEVTHHFGAGLEMDTHEEFQPGEDPRKFSPVHLPSLSLRALQRLRECLQQPRSIALDIDLHMGSKSVCSDMMQVLLEQFSDILTNAGKAEASTLLATRSHAAQQSILDYISGLTAQELSEAENKSTSSETLMRPELGMEAVDISICELPGFAVQRPLAVALMRLAHPYQVNDTKKTPVRYAALVLCSADKAEEPRLAQEVGRAIATMFMDEEFSAAVRTAGRSHGVLKAFDSYLSTLTIVPTVYMAGDDTAPENAAENLAAHLLSDSLVDSIENLICRVRGLPRREHDTHKLHHHTLPNETHTKERRRRFLVETRAKVGQGTQWGLTHRLRQGLELDLATNQMRPHLPRVSVAALAHLRRLITQKTVALDVTAKSVQDAIDAVLAQLETAGMPQAINSWMEKSLCECMAHPSTSQAWGDRAGTPLDLGSKACNQILKASSGDLSCHILVATCRNLAPDHETTGAFLRFRTPLQINFGKTDVPVRFLTVIVGPESKQKELHALADSLAGLSVDEDLMGDLDAAGNVNQYIKAVDTCLENLVVCPHARVHSGPSHNSRGSKSTCESNNHKDSPQTAVQAFVDPNHEREHQSTFSGKSGKSLVRTNSGTEIVKQTKTQGTLASSRKRRSWIKWLVSKARKYSLPLVLGVVLALAWSNLHEDSYQSFAEGIWFGAELMGHGISLHFIVNDIFMCFFFGLAIKEVTEALLPGGSLSPLKRAVNPLMATLGGVVGPIACYIVCVMILDSVGMFDGMMCQSLAKSDDHRRLAGGGAVKLGPPEPCDKAALIKGWGVPTATDISLAWMFALLIFGAGHPAINFLLLLAIVDDALGMIIIAVFYQDESAAADPLQKLWLLLVIVAIVMAWQLRRWEVMRWQVYILLCGPVSWLGLIKAGVHPALALVFVVPFMPATHARRRTNQSECHLGEADLGPAEDKAMEVLEKMGVPAKLKRSHAIEAARLLMLYAGDQAPLHVFEHTMKLPVDFGMFFFGLANAGVKLTEFGGITLSVMFALAVGKTLGIAFFALGAVSMGFGLPNGVTVTDLFAMSALGGVGLTVALFVSNQAFVDPGLKGQAKMGAVISVSCAGLAWAIKYTGDFFFNRNEELFAEDLELQEEDDADKVWGFGDFDERSSGGSGQSVPASDWIDNLLVDEILQILWTQKQYEARGTKLPAEVAATRSSSKQRTASRGGTDSTSMGDWDRSSVQFGPSPTPRRGSKEGSSLVLGPGVLGTRRSSKDRSSSRPPALQVEFDSACPTPPNSVSVSTVWQSPASRTGARHQSWPHLTPQSLRSSTESSSPWKSTSDS